jgi:ClpP class serine protease
MLDEMHESFKALVRERRKGKLTGDEKVIFSGEFWRGEKALGLGLIDGLGHLNEVLRRKFGEKVELKQIAASTGWGLRRIGMSNPSDLPEAALQALETRAWWSRFGL